MRYTKHVFVCCNQKANGKACCGEERGMAILEEMRKLAAEKGLGKDFRIQKSGCLDACGKGPTMVVYPEGTYYGNLKLEDLSEIIESHLINGKEVGRLTLEF